MSKVYNYLTQMKELPPEREPDDIKEVKKQPVKPTFAKSEKEEVAEQKKIQTMDFAATKASELSRVGSEDAESKLGLPVSAKDIILAVINLISIVFLIIILLRFPERAQELKNLRIEEIKNTSEVQAKHFDIDLHKEKADRLDKLFLDESGVVDFVNAVEGLRSESGAIIGVTFANQKPLKDKSGKLGLPVVIQLSGSWQTIGQDLQKIQELPFIFRPAKIEAEKDDEGVVVFKYGVVLYVSDNLGENR